MTTVLVVDDDPLFRGLVVKTLQRMEQISILEASDVELAKKLIKQRAHERKAIDVLLTDLRMGDGDGLDLIETLPDLSPSTMPILMSGVASPRDIQSALRLGAVDVLIKPFSREALSLALQRASDSSSGFRGSFHGLSLADLLQMLHLARRSLILEIRGHKLHGIIAFEEGQMVHAEAGASKGMLALQRFLDLKVGSLATAPFRKTERTLSGDFQGLLLDAFREIDEQSQLAEVPMPTSSQMVELLDSAPQLELLPVDAPPGAPPSSAGDEWESLPGFVASLDPELGVALERRGAFDVLLAGRMSADRWNQLLMQIGWLSSRIHGPWSQLLWIVGDLGLSVIDLPERGARVVMAQRFSGTLDDRRFRWNVSCVARFLLEEFPTGGAT